MGNDVLCQCNPGHKDKERLRSESVTQVMRIFKGTTIQVLQGDLVDLSIKCLGIVQSYTKSHLVKSDKHLKRTQREAIKSMRVGEVVLVPIHKRPVIHCKLPMFQEVKDLLRVYQTYEKCLSLVEQEQIQEVTFTEQNASNFAIPKQYNAETMLRCIFNYLNLKQSQITCVNFISTDYVSLNMFKYELEKQLDEQRIPELAEKNNRTFLQFINNELVAEEKNPYYSTGLTTSLGKWSLDESGGDLQEPIQH